MLKEFVEAIAAMAVKSSGAQIIKGSDPRSEYMLFNGQVTTFPVPRPLMQSEVRTLPSLFDAIARFGNGESSIWHDGFLITALLDDGDRLETVNVNLVLSDQIEAVCSLPRSFDQRGLILFLKRDLAGAIDEGIIPIFRTLDFSKREEAKVSVKHGDESLGKAVHAAVVGATAIPEYINVTPIVYITPALGIRANIRLSVDIDPQRGTIELTALPDEVQLALQRAMDIVHETLVELAEEASVDVPVFYGRPLFKDAR